MINSKSTGLIVGVDEAGRGPLAGPVVAAAVVFNSADFPEGLADSKKLTARKREYLYNEIIKKALYFSINQASSLEIDNLNILQAALLAMKRAVDQLKISPEIVYVDGNKLPAWDYNSEAIVKGDSKIKEISAASILAKVYRDRLMQQYDLQYPEYAFAQHKGYPTKLHIQKIKQFGVLDIHRKSFRPVKNCM